jgi:hypothetical protein
LFVYFTPATAEFKFVFSFVEFPDLIVDGHDVFLMVSVC